jgi:hypothetical protein
MGVLAGRTGALGGVLAVLVARVALGLQGESGV